MLRRPRGELLVTLEAYRKIIDGRALDFLTPISEAVPVSVLQSLVPALRWIAVTAAPGGDGMAWRAWLEERAGKRKPANRERLVLPSARPE
jgi:hypothetical protein